MSKSLAITLFLGLLLVGIAFGVARDLYSTQRAALSGEVIEVNAGGRDYKSPSMRSPSLKVRLTDGRVVDVSTTTTAGIRAGQTVSVLEMVMPWGQLWYTLNSK